MLFPLVPRLLAAASAADRARERAAEVLGRGGYQRDLPGAVEPFTLDLPHLGVLWRLLTVLAWTGLAVLATLFAVWAVRRLAGWRRPEAHGGGGGEPAVLAEIHIASAEALGAQGRYAEAIHALLLETLQALSRAARLPPCFTSREIVARVPLRGEAREALAGLVAAVEVSWFGGAEPSEADYRLCLSRFHAFRASYRSAG